MGRILTLNDGTDVTILDDREDSLKLVEERLSPDIAEILRSSPKEMDELLYAKEVAESECESYEMELEDIQTDLGDFKETLHILIDEILSGKRVNKEKLLTSLKDMDGLVSEWV